MVQPNVLIKKTINKIYFEKLFQSLCFIILNLKILKKEPMNREVNVEVSATASNKSYSPGKGIFFYSIEIYIFANFFKRPFRFKRKINVPPTFVNKCEH